MTTLDTYTDTDASDHEFAKQAIARTLTHEARSKDNAISSADLAERTPVSASTVRDLIVEVRREYRLPIASANGYYVAETQDEASEFIERQKRQAETSMQTARDFAKAFNGSDL